MNSEENFELVKDYCSKHTCVECVLTALCDPFTSWHEKSDELVSKCADIVRQQYNPNVDHPNHYNQGFIECIDAMESAFGEEEVKCFCKCNAFKYIWRSELKNGLEDIDKAIYYLNKYKELCKGESVNE